MVKVWPSPREGTHIEHVRSREPLHGGELSAKVFGETRDDLRTPSLEIFEVTGDIIAERRKYRLIISDTMPFEQAQLALELAATPEAADKVVIVF